jgi:hypothetical protein
MTTRSQWREFSPVSSSFARIDAQRQQLAGQLGELEATERVLARYSAGTKRTVSATPNQCWIRCPVAAAPPMNFCLVLTKGQTAVRRELEAQLSSQRSS